ncbi:MAG: Asp-tRNA(Asn)/Glu-tRNA(Gln) amidotransferase GatCAB subunit A [Acidimicrobiaceae bacterium]|nr:Asp-tRNA(Asn)/Glu-tRNA(Gln) amidotransferase GatCAB subunit A [Acidimicrobiaceae bacterium]
MSAEATAHEIVAAVRSGVRTAREVLEEHLAAVEAREDEVHAFNLVLADEARAAADAVDASVAAGTDPGPLAGVPVALKDNMCTRGVPTTCSSRILDGWRPPYDATVVERLAAAGAVVVGKTNLDEFAMGSSTENSAFGVTRNPLDPTKVPGGSSGGSAAAVAAGFVPLSLGSDTGGSIRQPAALCGVVGVKPTYGAVSRYGLVAFASSLDQIGPFSRTVADSALMLEVIGGHDPLDSTSIPEPAPGLSSVLDRGVEGMRIGIIEELSGDGLEGIAGDVRARLGEAAAALAAAGATVETTSVPSTVYGLSAYYVIAPAEASSNLARYDGVRFGLRVDAPNAGDMNTATRTAGFGDEVKRRIMLGTYALSAGYYEAYYGKSQKVRTLIVRDFARAYEDFDLLLSPTAPTTAFPIGAKTADPMTMYLNDVCTIPSNLAGHPAMSVPFGLGDDGMPVGVQVLAPATGEATMFRAAAVLEAAAPAGHALVGGALVAGSDAGGAR